MKKKFRILGVFVCIFFLTSCSIWSTKTPKNPFEGRDMTSLWTITTNPVEYLDKSVYIGPLVVLENDLERMCFMVSTYVDEKIDEDMKIEVCYDGLLETDQWENLSSKENPTIYTYGSLVKYSDTGEHYIKAISVKLPE